MSEEVKKKAAKPKVNAPKTDKPVEKPKIEQPSEPGKVYDISEGIKTARSQAKQRKFKQTWDLAINLKGMDLKKPENRLNLEFQLPSGRGKKLKVGVIADSLASDAEKIADLVVRKEEIPKLLKKKKDLKKLADQVDWFYGEISLMPLIGKSFGVILGPRGKMPKPLPPKGYENFIERARNLVKISVKESPVIHVSVGSEEMNDKEIEKNVEALVNFVKDKLPKGINNIRSIYLKLTMGKPVKLMVR